MKNHSKYNISFRAKENREITRKEALIKLENTLQLPLLPVYCFNPKDCQAESTSRAARPGWE